MTTMKHRQTKSPRGSTPYAEQCGYLVFSAVPLGSEALLGTRLKDAGALPPGDYRCEIDVAGWEKGFDVTIRPTAISGGTYAPSVSVLLLNRTTAKATVAGANFAANTTQTIVSPASGTLTGERLAVVTFSVPSAQTLTFGATALAEFCGR